MTDRYRAVITPRNREQAVEAVRRARPGSVIDIRTGTRSLQSNARAWATLDAIAAHVEWHGQRLTSDDWKAVFSAAVRQQRLVPGLDSGFVAIGAHTSEFSPSEMSDMITLMEAFAAERGIDIGAPEDSGAAPLARDSERAAGRGAASETK